MRNCNDKCTPVIMQVETLHFTITCVFKWICRQVVVMINVPLVCSKTAQQEEEAIQYLLKDQIFSLIDLLLSSVLMCFLYSWIIYVWLCFKRDWGTTPVMCCYWRKLWHVLFVYLCAGIAAGCLFHVYKYLCCFFLVKYCLCL